MNRRIVPPCCTLLAAFALLPASLPAQTSQAASSAKPTTAAGDIQRSYATVKANILKSAETMPPDAYAFRPTPDIRSFARVVNHVSEAQLRSCGALNQTAPDTLPKVPAETAGKAAVLAALEASFAECDKAYGSLTGADLLEPITVGPVTRARISVAWGNVAHDSEQYATLALYMRLKGLTPPSSEK